jgi:hypothetical protein
MPAATVDVFGKLRLTLHRPERQVGNEDESAVRAWVAYTRAYYKSLATNVEDPQLATVATTAELRGIRSYLADRGAKKVRTGGALEITIKLESTGPLEAKLSGCMDQSGLKIVHPDGTSHPDPSVVTEPKVDLLPRLDYELGSWHVDSSRPTNLSSYCRGGEWPSEY